MKGGEKKKKLLRNYTKFLYIDFVNRLCGSRWQLGVFIFVQPSVSCFVAVSV